MDPLSQAAFGAVAGQLSTRRRYYALAIVAGALGGMASDLDVLIRSSSDPLMGLMMHRYFTHSLAFIPVGGLMVTLTLYGIAWAWRKWWFPTKRKATNATLPNFYRMWFLTTVGFATHGLVDAMTSYGTVLFWPFTDKRISLDWVSIIDPIVTLPLLLGIWLSYRKTSPKPLAYCTIFVGAYLSFLATWHARTETLFNEQLAKHNIVADHVRVMPALFEPLTYRAVYRADGEIVITKLQTTLNDKMIMTPAGRVPLFDSTTKPLSLKLRKQLKNYNWFADGFTGVYSQNPLILGDYRYGSFDTPPKPLWGLEVNVENSTVKPVSLRFQ